MARRNIFSRMWNYLRTALGMRFEEAADPRVQLEQAIQEAQDQHRQLKEQAASVIANQKQTEVKLERSMEELEKLSGNAQQALLMAEEARAGGDDAKAAEYERAAETIATKLIAVEREVEDLKALHLNAVQASEQAKNAVAQNSATLQKKLSEKQQLLSQLDQAKMAETMNDAMASLSETVGQEAPTFAEVRDKIEKRMAKAQGRAELEGSTVEARMLEVEQAQRNVDAQRRLSELRSKLGIAGAPATQTAPADTAPAAPAPAEAEAEPAPPPAPTEAEDSDPATRPAEG
jgi:phage shock protein A